MKKILCILLAMLLLAGCSSQTPLVEEAPPIETPNPKGYMAEPQILINTVHQYKQESWLSEYIELQDNLVLQGNDFFATIIVQGSISEEVFKKAVKLEGYGGEVDVTITSSEGKTVYYGGFRKLEKNKPYKLVVSKDIMDSEGKTLSSDIQREITLKPDTTAIYTFVGKTGSISGLGWNTIFDSFAVDNMNLTPEANTFIVDFSAEVDTASVEQSVKENLTNRDVKCSFEWSGAKKLTLKLEDLKDGEPEPYMISMQKAKDKEGNTVYGNFYFVTSKANSIGSINLKTKKAEVIYTLPDMRYMPVQSSRINNGIILDDTAAKYIFNMTSKSLNKLDINREYTLGIPSLSFIYTYKDSNTILLLNRAEGIILSYSLLDGSSKKLFALPTEIAKANVIEMSASPDGSKLVIAYETLPPGTQTKHDFEIRVLDMVGNSLYTSKNQYMPRFLELFGARANMKWLGNETLIMEDNVSKAELQDYNVISINTANGDKRIIAEHAFKPALLPNSNIMMVESFKEFGSGQRSIDIMKDGRKLRSFKAESYQYDNFIFADQNTLLFNEGEKLMAYYIDKGKLEQLGKGYIIGLSEDGSQIYYMTNYRMLYYID